MNRLSKVIVTTAFGAICLGTVLASTAQASCVSLDERGGTSWRLPTSSRQSGTFAPAAATFVLDPSAPDASIVGFWRVEFTADGADKPFDSALVQWHSDGTEIMNSSRDPRTQSFCLGVWEKTGAFTYVLKHLAISWDGAGNAVGPATILEHVSLAHHGDTFTGRFVITQYDLEGTTILPPTPITGTLSGTRITPN